jgi:hypothetical protein
MKHNEQAQLAKAGRGKNSIGSPCHEAARKYHRNKLPITLCYPQSKKPFPKDWPNKRWTQREIDDEFRRREFNVGLILGPASGMIDIECDGADSQETLLELFENDVPVTPTWQSIRGAHRLFAWSAELAALNKASVKFGSLEVRLGANGKGAQSLLPPSVTDGHCREWKVPLDECPPAPLPECVLRRLCAEISKTTENNSDRSTDDTLWQGNELTQSTQENTETSRGVFSVSTPGVFLCVNPAFTLTEAIERTIPSERGHRHNQIFAFVRHLKAIPALASADVSALVPIVKQWHSAALPYIGTKDFDSTFIDFADAWERAEYPIGAGPLQETFMNSLTQSLPKCAEKYDCDSFRRMVLLCRQLQQQAGDKQPFFLACRSAAEVLGLSHNLANRWLRFLVRDGILEVISKGTRHKASEFRYLGD